MPFLELTERRNNDPKLLNPFKHFEFVTREEVYEQVQSTCGNITSYLIDGDYALSAECSYPNSIFKNKKPFYEQVSAPYLLARLVAAGCKIDVHGQEGYKVTWEVWLKHKKTGHFLSFYDYKGASSIGSDIHTKIMPPSFSKSVINLVKSLVNNRFPHPYDGCVVGEIA